MATFGVDGPASDAFAITPSDSVNFSKETRAIYVGVGGNIAVVMGSGNTVTFTAVPAGAILPIKATRVNSTSTTATTMLGLI